MSDKDQKIKALKETVGAIEQEISLAVMFHETWKPTAYDQQLHARMGISYAAHSFSIIRSALRREMLLAVLRIWDNDDRSIGLRSVLKTLGDDDFFEAFVMHRAGRLNKSRVTLTPEPGQFSGFDDCLRDALLQKKDEMNALVARYSKGGDSYHVVEHLLTMRNVSLAHKQREPKAPGRADATDEQIESFYQDSLEIVRLLLSLVQGKAFDLTEAAGVYQHHARYFWAAARGERTEGHPDYRPPAEAGRIA